MNSTFENGTNVSMLEHNTLKYEKILEDLIAVRDWLLKKKISIDDTRFAAILSNMEALVSAYKADTISELVKNRETAEIFVTPIDAVAFIDIHKAFGDLKDHEGIPISKIKKILSGPYLAHDEDLEDNESRNILFELELAAIFHKRGLKVNGFDDFSFDLDDTKIYVECKRPVSEQAIVSSIGNAATKLTAQMNRHAGESKALIAVSLDKVMGADKGVLRVDSQKQLEKELTKRIWKQIKSNRENYWKRMLNLNFLGVIFVLNYIVQIKKDAVNSKGVQCIIDSVQAPFPLQAENRQILDQLEALLSPANGS